jgi:hypothetical protein
MTDPRSLEDRALDDPDAQRALLAQCAEQMSHPRLLSADIDRDERARSTLDLLDAIGVDPASLGDVASANAALIARRLARDELAVGRARAAIALLERAERWQASGPLDARAEAQVDLAHAFELVGDASRANAAWVRAFDLARQCADAETRAWLVHECATALARDARASGDEASATQLEAEADRADDDDITEQLAGLAPALAWFTARWIDGEPPALPAPEAWLSRSTGVVSNASEDPAVSESLRCARVFGSGLDFVCLCGALSGRDTAGAACELCGVESMRAARTLCRIGHLPLPTKLLHPAALAVGPCGSTAALALDLSDERLAAVLEGRRCLRRAISAPRGADTLEPGSAELREYDEGRGDPSVVIESGEEAVIAALEALDASGARAECEVERRALEAHRSAQTPAGRARIAALEARAKVLARLGAEGASAAWVSEVVPVWSAPWMARAPRAAPMRSAYIALVTECERLSGAWSIGEGDRGALRERVRALLACFD